MNRIRSKWSNLCNQLYLKYVFIPHCLRLESNRKPQVLTAELIFVQGFIKNLMATLLVIDYQLRIYSSKIPSIAAKLLRTEGKNFHSDRKDFFESSRIKKTNWHRFPTLIITTPWGKCSKSSWLISIQEGLWHTCHQGSGDASLSGPY